MKTRIITVAAVAGLVAAVAAGDVFAAGRGNGGGKGQRARNCTSTTAATGAAAATRPAGSQRRDGTFLTTGMTANGSTTRPLNGRGLQDGSRLTTPTAPVTPAQ
jgi:fructose-1,6-bisphosphatase/inositol monophosphatase family enzyme